MDLVRFHLLFPSVVICTQYLPLHRLRFVILLYKSSTLPSGCCSNGLVCSARPSLSNRLHFRSRKMPPYPFHSRVVSFFPATTTLATTTTYKLQTTDYRPTTLCAGNVKPNFIPYRRYFALPQRARTTHVHSVYIKAKRGFREEGQRNGIGVMRQATTPFFKKLKINNKLIISKFIFYISM